VENLTDSWLKRSTVVNRIILLLVGSALALSMSACDSEQDVASDVPFEELVSNPQRYHGRRVCTEGIHVTGFETSAPGASLRQEGEAVYLTELVIWLAGAETRSTSDGVESGAFPTARLCRATVHGLYQSGGHYGHLGGYAYQLRAEDR
jgi:hypothetical protein